MASETATETGISITVLDPEGTNLALRLEQAGETKDLTLGQVLQGLAFVLVSGDIPQAVDVLFELHKAIEPEIFEEDDE